MVGEEEEEEEAEEEEEVLELRWCSSSRSKLSPTESRWGRRWAWSGWSLSLRRRSQQVPRAIWLASWHWSTRMSIGDCNLPVLKYFGHSLGPCESSE